MPGLHPSPKGGLGFHPLAFGAVVDPRGGKVEVDHEEKTTHSSGAVGGCRVATQGVGTGSRFSPKFGPPTDRSPFPP